MNIKMIVTDLDRTLLRNDKTISDFTVSTFLRLKAMGIKVVFATARPIRSVKTLPCVATISPDAIIYHNGAVVTVEGNHHISYGIPHETAKSILLTAASRFPDARMSVEISDTLYANFEFPKEEGLDWSCVLSDFTDLPAHFADKLVFSPPHDDMPLDDTLINGIKSLLPDGLYAVPSEDRLLLVMAKTAVKHLAVAKVAGYFGLTPADAVAFGDDYNDIEMLQECGIGVAVSNAIEEVKAVSDFICDSNENDGVAKWLGQNLLF